MHLNLKWEGNLMFSNMILKCILWLTNFHFENSMTPVNKTITCNWYLKPITPIPKTELQRFMCVFPNFCCFFNVCFDCFFKFKMYYSNITGLKIHKPCLGINATSLISNILLSDCRPKKNWADHKYKKNIAMTVCLVILYPAWRQPTSLYSFCLLYSVFAT